MMLLYKTVPIDGDTAARLASLPPPLAAYAEGKPRGEAGARRIAALTALAQLLSYMEIPCPAVEISPYGKPDFTNSGYCFSLSHAGELAVAALSTCPLGVDIEPYDRPLPDGRMARLTEHYFQGAEKEELTALSGEARRRAFLEGFVKKEAYAKRDGRGLAALRSVDTLAEPPRLTETVTHNGRDYFLAIY